MADTRVVITGIGVVTPLGIGRETFWRNSCLGNLALRKHLVGENGAARSVVAGKVDEFSPELYVPPKVIKQTDRSTHMAIAACQLAASDAGLDLKTLPPESMGMYFSTLFGGMEFAEPELYAQAHLGPERVSAYQAIAWFYAATQGQWSIQQGLRGYAKTVVGDRAGGLQALALASLAIRQGHSRIMFAGGFDAPLVPFTLAIHSASGLLSRETKDVEKSYLPFDRRRSGLILSEGAGILVLEELEHARARNAHIYAEIAGGASCCDGGSSASGTTRLDACMQQALEDSRMKPSEVNHILAEGVATQEDDRIEADAIARVFNAAAPTVSAPKSMMGHALSAAGLIDCAWACLMIEHGMLLPTASLQEPDPNCSLLHVREARKTAGLNALLCASRGYGGTNAAVVLRRFAGTGGEGNYETANRC